MNKLIAALAIILVLVAGLFFALNQSENKVNLYEDVTKVNTVNHGSTTDYFVYFSKESCPHCEDVRPDVEKFIEELEKNNPEVDFYLVDMDDMNNSKYWSESDNPVAGVDYYIDPAAVPEGFNLEDFRIAGTPTLIYVSGGVITDIAIGASSEKTETKAMGVSELLEKKAEELGFEFNASFND